LNVSDDLFIGHHQIVAASINLGAQHLNVGQIVFAVYPEPLQGFADEYVLNDPLTQG
jgi:hypothetical protein